MWLLALFGVAVAAALFAGNNQGTVTLFWPPYRIDVSLNMALLAMVAAFLVASSIAGSVMVRPGLEDGAGPRTAVARILRMLAFTVVLAGAFLLVARPGGTPGGTPGG